MDLTKILGHLENSEELIKQIESELGKDFVPRSEFNNKNNAHKELEKQLDELNESLTSATSEKTTLEQTIAELTSKVSTTELKAMKSQIAYEMGLPFELAGRLSGEDEAGLRADAESLSKLVSKTPTPPLRSSEPGGEDKDAAYKKMLNQLKGD